MSEDQSSRSRGCHASWWLGESVSTRSTRLNNNGVCADRVDREERVEHAGGQPRQAAVCRARGVIRQPLAARKDVPNSFVVNDDVEVGFGNKIPLWLFGFLY